MTNEQLKNLLKIYGNELELRILNRETGRHETLADVELCGDYLLILPTLWIEH